MKSKISVITMFFLAFITLSSFAPNNTSVPAPVISSTITKTALEAPKADKKAERIQKLLNSKAAKWLLAKMQKRAEKRHEKLSKKLAIAEKAGDVKKVDKIKKQLDSKKGDLKKLSIALIVIGLICLLVGILVSSGPLYGVGGLLLLVGLIILLLDYMDVI